ncbi:MAG TPA: hypothetical protein VJ843_01845 [Candidatus Saccharimonadales bacterium]|nr:hypothetical protein [Candidatus Saccharimonadales bacterium]
MGTPALTACSLDDNDDTTTQNVYCVDNDGNIIDPDNCSDDNGYYYGGYPTYLWVTSVHHSVGYHVPANQRRGGSYFQANNTTARQHAGLTPSGRAPTTVKRSGGFGKSGSSGSHTTGRSGSGTTSHGFGGHSSGG